MELTTLYYKKRREHENSNKALITDIWKRIPNRFSILEKESILRSELRKTESLKNSFAERKEDSPIVSRVYQNNFKKDLLNFFKKAHFEYYNEQTWVDDFIKEKATALKDHHTMRYNVIRNDKNAVDNCYKDLKFLTEFEAKSTVNWLAKATIFHEFIKNPLPATQIPPISSISLPSSRPSFDKFKKRGEFANELNHKTTDSLKKAVRRIDPNGWPEGKNMFHPDEQRAIYEILNPKNR